MRGYKISIYNEDGTLIESDLITDITDDDTIRTDTLINFVNDYTSYLSASATTTTSKDNARAIISKASKYMKYLEKYKLNNVKIEQTVI